jgi:hypothetical protein
VLLIAQAGAGEVPVEPVLLALVVTIHPEANMAVVVVALVKAVAAAHWVIKTILQ